MFNPQRRPETWENKNQKSRREQRYEWVKENRIELLNILSEESEDNFNNISENYKQTNDIDKFIERNKRWSNEYVRRLKKVLSSN